MQIALVEPSRTVCRIVTDMIQPWNHQVTSYGGGKDALACLRENPDVRTLITSAELQAGSGLQLCSDARALAGDHRPLYIVLMSSNDEQEKRVQALENGADDFITKPPAPEELRARLGVAERVTTLQSNLIQLATTDSLTGLSTRRAFFEGAANSWEIDRPLSIAVCDLDNFKAINDSYGHEVGDLVLRHVGLEAKTLDLPAGRLGGEEFAFIIEGELDDAIEWADQFRRTIARILVPVGKTAINFTCSFGVAQREPGDTIDRLLRRADIALYEAKRCGRNRVVASDSFALTEDHDRWRGVARISPRQ